MGACMRERRGGAWRLGWRGSSNHLPPPPPHIPALRAALGPSKQREHGPAGVAHCAQPWGGRLFNPGQRLVFSAFWPVTVAGRGGGRRGVTRRGRRGGRSAYSFCTRRATHSSTLGRTRALTLKTDVSPTGVRTRVTRFFARESFLLLRGRAEKWGPTSRAPRVAVSSATLRALPGLCTPGRRVA